MAFQYVELHEEDYIRDYEKVEPLVSLNPSEIAVERKLRDEFEDRLGRLERQIMEYAQKHIL